MITISTVGVPSTIKKLASHKLQSTLAVRYTPPPKKKKEKEKRTPVFTPRFNNVLILFLLTKPVLSIGFFLEILALFTMSKL